MISGIKKITFSEKFAEFDDIYSPRILAEMDDYHLKAAKFHGDFPWHSHDNEDELFLVIKGTITIHLRNEKIRLCEGEMIIIPRGIEHHPSAEDEAHVLLFEKKSTVNTGNEKNEFTKIELERI